MVAFAGLTGLFIGSLITFVAWQSYFEFYSKKAERTIKFLKAIKSDKVKIDIIEHHKFAAPDDVSDLKFGG